MAKYSMIIKPAKDNEYPDEYFPETYASLVREGVFPGIIKAKPNTSHTVAQVRNIILSPNDADPNVMQEGDIWIKYN